MYVRLLFLFLLLLPNKSGDPQDGEVDRATIEEYVELEKKIAGAETHSPALILQQKKDQLVRLLLL